MTAVSRRTFGGTLLGAALTLELWPQASQAADEVRTYRVVIEDFAFVPAVVTLHPGDRVEWINKDIAPHTATASDGAWDTGELTADKIGSIQVEGTAEIDYFCVYHSHRGIVDQRRRLGQAA